jgi:hypothetical protein
MLETDLKTLEEIKLLVKLPVTHLKNNLVEEYRIDLPENIKGNEVSNLCILLKNHFKGRFKYCSPTRYEERPVLELGLSNFKTAKSLSKTKTPRQKLYSVLMTELAGARGEELANLLDSGKETKFQDEFAASVANMCKKFKKLNK